jgi:hypothetical protein
MLKDRRDQVHAGSEIAEKGTASREKDAEVGPEKWLKKAGEESPSHAGAHAKS